MNGITLPVTTENQAAREGPIRRVILDDLSMEERVSDFLHREAVRTSFFIRVVGYPNPSRRYGIFEFLDFHRIESESCPKLSLAIMDPILPKQKRSESLK